MRITLVDPDYFRAIDSMVEGSRELCLMKQKNGEYTQYTQGNLISATGEKECCETLTISKQIRKVRSLKHKGLYLALHVMLSISWGVRSVQSPAGHGWLQSVYATLSWLAFWHGLLLFCYEVFPSA